MSIQMSIQYLVIVSLFAACCSKLNGDIVVFFSVFNSLTLTNIRPMSFESECWLEPTLVVTLASLMKELLANTPVCSH